MKKTILILIVAIFCLQFDAISQNAKVGVTAGLGISNMRGTRGGKDIDGNSTAGYTFGMIVDKPLRGNFTFQPGLHYVQKGMEQDMGTGNNSKQVASALRYAELQLNVLYNSSNSGASFFIGLGPAVSVTLPSKYVTTIGGTKTETDLPFGNESGDLRNFDIGPNVLAGFKLPGGFLVSVNYTLGVRNLIPGGVAPDEIRNSSFGLRIGMLVKN